MREVSQEGRTVLLVSHNLVSIEALCGTCILLDGGKLVSFGPVEQTTREYRRRIQGSQEQCQVRFGDTDSEVGTPRVLNSLVLSDSFGEVTRCFPLGGPFSLKIGIDMPLTGDLPVIVIRIDDNYGQRLMTIKNPGSRSAFDPGAGLQQIVCCIPEFPLTPGEYWIGVAIFVNEQLMDEANRAVSFTIVNSDAFGSSRGASNGVCVARSVWKTLQAPVSPAPIEIAPAAEGGVLTSHNGRF
jgi:lipopolysaccharide transport system ATP-binding protein